MLSLEEISDRLELQHLLISYSEAIDRREFDELDAIFTPDAYIDYRDTGGIDGQYPQIKAWLADVLPTYFSRNAHMLGLPAIKLAGDTATARTFCFNPMVLKGDKPRDHAGRGLVRRRVRPHRRWLADIPSRRGQVLRQGAVRVFTHPTCVVCCGDFSKSAATSATVDGPVDRAIFAGSGRSGTMTGCLPRDYGCAAVTHVRQNRIRATARDR